MVAEVLALIPARGGSKGIPRKNIKLLGGFPLIAYSIAAGQEAKLVSRVILSTDDQEIAEIARACGAEVPFLRPPEYAQDDTRDLPVFQHALRWLADREDYHPDVVVQLRPTTPFRPPDLVDGAIEVFLAHDEVSSVRGVVPSGQNPYKMWRIQDQGRLQPLLESEFDEPYNMPRQELPDTYWQTGHIDVIDPAVIRQGSMSGSFLYPYVIDPRFTVDLDNQLDWEKAEARIRELNDDIVTPGPESSARFDDLKLVVLDFDGVLTDNRVYVDQNGKETVAAHRGDGMGISLLRKAGIKVMILSKETNPVVTARAEKLKLPVMQGIDEKGVVLGNYLTEHNINPEHVVYVGNDVNDLPCFSLVGLAFAVADAHPEVLKQADAVLSKPGGHGAVRELCDMVLRERS
jgi:N-acylneuraminate cytidylyltransferase